MQRCIIFSFNGAKLSSGPNAVGIHFTLEMLEGCGCDGKGVEKKERMKDVPPMKGERLSHWRRERESWTRVGENKGVTTKGKKGERVTKEETN